ARRPATGHAGLHRAEPYRQCADHRDRRTGALVMKTRSFVCTAVLAAGLSLAAGGRAADGFDIVALGALGGIQDGNLSAWLVYPHDDTRAVTFDAGTLVNGLRAAEEKGTLDSIKVPVESGLSRAGYVLTDRIKGYLVSHAHL